MNISTQLKPIYCVFGVWIDVRVSRNDICIFIFFVLRYVFDERYTLFSFIVFGFQISIGSTNRVKRLQALIIMSKKKKNRLVHE